MYLKKWAIAAMVGISCHVQATEDISYKWFEAGIQHTNVDDFRGEFDLDWQSIYLEGSYAFNERSYITGGYRDQVTGDDIEFRVFNIGLGFYNSITSSTDFYGEIVGGNVDSILNSEDINYYGLKLGTRTAVKSNLEFISGLEYQRDEDGRVEDFILDLGLLFKLSDPSHAIRSSFNIEDDGDLWSLEFGYRKSF